MKTRITLLLALLILTALMLSACGGRPASTTAPSGSALASGDADAGAKVFASRCARCHTSELSTDAVSMAGLFHGGTTLPGGVDYGGKLPNGQEITDENVIAWIRDGGTGKIGRMPGFGLNDTDMANLIAYLKTLK